MRRALIVTSIGALLACPAHAENPALEACSSIVNKNDRLLCYDAAATNKPPPRSYLTRALDLDGQGNPDADGIRRLEPYCKNYALIRYTSNINKTQSSPSPNHTVDAPYPYMKFETKFQFSAKSEIGNYRDMNFPGFKNFRLWGPLRNRPFGKPSM